MSGLTQARHLVELGRYDVARPVIGSLLAEDPDSAELHGLMAQALIGLEDLQGALAQGNRLVALAPDDEWGHRICAIVLTQTRRYDEATRAASAAVRLAPSSAQCHLRYALAAMHVHGLKPEARRAALRAVELAPNLPDAHFVLGVVEASLGHRADAVRAYERTLQLDPQHANALNNLTVAQRPRSLRRAVDGYAAALHADPHNQTARGNIDVQMRRFARRVYWGALVGLAVALVVAATGSPTPWTVAVVVLVVGALAGSTWRLGSQVPVGIRRYAVSRIGQDGQLTGRLILSLLMLVVTLVVCLVPGTVVIGLVLVRPLAVANVVLVIASARRRR